MALTMSAQPTFNGVTLGGAAGSPTIINRSDKPVLGYALQRHPITSYNPVLMVVDLGSLATGKLIQPGEGRTLWPFNIRSVSLSGNEEEETISYELKAVLFADGTFYGPDSIFLDFSYRVTTARSLALNMQYSGQDKYRLLEQEKQAMPRALLDALRRGAPVRPETSQDFQNLEVRMQMSNLLLGIRDSKGDEAVDAALGRIAALPDVQRGEQQ
jgi:hypothetical protein